MDVKETKMKTQDIKNVAAAWAQVQEAQKAALAKKLAKASASSEKGKAAVTLPKAPWDKKEQNEALKGDQHKLDHDKDGDIDADDFKALRKKKKNAKEVVNTKPQMKDNSKDTEMAERNESRRPIFDRIMEKAGGREDHVKGATPPEAMDSKASGMEKDFVAKHGGLDGNDSGIDGAKAAADTAKAATAQVKAAPARSGDNKNGDTKPVKSTEA